MKHKSGGKECFLPPLLLCVDYFCIHDLPYPVSDIVHQSDPLHLIFCLELPCHPITLCHLIHQLKKHILCLLVDASKAFVQFASCLQRSVLTCNLKCDSLRPFEKTFICKEKRTQPAKTTIEGTHISQIMGRRKQR